MEPELNYSTLVFKCKGQPPQAEANDDSTIYSSVKREKTIDVSPNKEEKRSVNAAQSEAASQPRHFRLLVACSVTLCILILLSIIAIIYIAVMMNEGKAEFKAKLSNLTAENQQLLWERSVLQNNTDNLNWTLGLILKFTTFPVAEYCSQNRCQQCQNGWIQFQDKCYLFYESAPPWKTWTQARAFCQSSVSDLVVIDSLQEQNFVSKTIKYYYDKHHGYWIGLNQTAANYWRWVDGRNDTLGYWSTQTFNSINVCALMLPTNNYTANWTPADCPMLNKFIYLKKTRTYTSRTRLTLEPGTRPSSSC